MEENINTGMRKLGNWDVYEIRVEDLPGPWSLVQALEMRPESTADWHFQQDMRRG